MHPIEWLAEFCEAMYVLARFYPPRPKGWLGGRLWERWTSKVLQPTGAWVGQGAGALTLFGSGSASGLAHEIDSAGARNDWTLICEAKAYKRVSPSKMDAFYFDRKTFDLYVARRLSGQAGPHWRVLVSAGPIKDALRRYCFLYGIITVDPEVIPLPVLLRMAGRPTADMFFQDTILAELVRLGEIACGSMESRYVPEGSQHLRFDMSKLNRRDLDDLLWLQKTVSDEFLDLVDQKCPGHFENHADEIISQLGLENDPAFFSYEDRAGSTTLIDDPLLAI
jgi:hypothetical protein